MGTNNIKEIICSVDVNSLSTSQKKIHEFVMHNFNKIDEYSIFELALATSTTASQITKYCKKLGYTGYKDFKYNFLLSSTPEPNSCNLFNLVCDQMTEVKLEEIYQQYRIHQNVLLIGSGPSYDIIKCVYNKIQKVNTDKILFMTSNKESAFEWLKFHKTPMVFAISVKGSTEEVNEPCNLSKLTNAYIVAITGTKNSRLDFLSDTAFYTNSNKKLTTEFSFDFTPRFQELYVLEIIFEYINSRTLYSKMEE